MRTIDRRRFLVVTTAATGLAAAPSFAKSNGDAGDLSPTEDLMREHGILERIELIYDAAVRRIDAGQPVPLAAARDTATLAQSFIEDYHERLEEDFVFPRFERAGHYVELVEILRAQHDAGRRLTARILAAVDEAHLVEPMRAYCTMMRAHTAREDTVLFPALRVLLGKSELRRLGRIFDDREAALFGDDGYARMVARVYTLEERFGVNDLSLATFHG